MGPLLFKAEDSPVYAPGFQAVVITSLLVAVLALVYRYVSIWENKKRDKAGILEAYEHAYDDDLTDRKVWLHSSRDMTRLTVSSCRIHNSDISFERQ